ncbi:heavy-metal-associated domain-containing protein [Mycetocola reblochoni]|nr:heavy-metal-associated domain-containing protein [Mycetocola reblochoni]RLP68152.1 copper chaperone [Mycetocola reblochoni]
MSTTQNYRIDGMTCAHCARSVSEEIAALGGVTGVDVDVPAGIAVVTSTAPLPDDAVRSAVDEAGYTLLGTDPE